MRFEWDKKKEAANIEKHGISFAEAEKAFEDENSLILPDLSHSENEKRWVCLGMVHAKVMTVRFTYRGEKIRIIGAAYWRKGRKRYEKENQI